MPSDVTRPIEPIRAPIARAPRRPLPPVAPRPRDDRGYDDRGHDYDEHGYDDWDYGDRGQAEPEFEEPEQEENNRAQSASRASSLLGSSALMAAGTMVSRLLGFVRASVLVAAVTPGGDAGAADAFSVANIMPNALYILLAGGVLNAVLVPQIARAAKQKDGGEDYINRLLTAALGLLAAVTVLVLLGSPLLVKVYASDDWSPDLITLTAAFSLWCLPQVFFYGVYTLLGQVLNARGKFGAFMWSPVLNNVVSIAGLAAFIAVYGGGTQSGTEWTDSKVMLLAGSQTLGVAAQALVLIPLLSRAGIRYRPKFGLRGVGLASASRVAGWTFAAVVVQQLAFVVISRVTTTASNLMKDHPEAAIDTGKAIYDNALLLFMLPHSLVAVSLVTALFTRMSNAAAENRLRDVRADLSLGLRLTGLATVVSTAAILALGPDIAASMFPSAHRSTTNGIAYVVMAMALGLVPFSAQYLFQRVFFAFEDAKTPFFIQIGTSGTWAVGNLISLYLLRETPQYIVIGVGLSMAASNFVSALLSYWILRMRFGDLDGRAVVRSHIELFAVGGIGGGVAWLMARSTHIFLGDGWVACIIASIVGGLMLLFVYVAGLRQLGVQEIEDVFGPLLRRLPSSPETVARHSTH
nr:murein biosynthesis integral membrane protein MurJ [Kineosporia mesophila]